jgi:UDP-N-acetylmuramoyl-tripeptide--D-alanyl-D-alanine ligase
MNLMIRQILAWLPLAQARSVGSLDRIIHRVHTDTRTLQSGDLYIALKGDQFDGNDYLKQAKEAGAAAVICSLGRAIEGIPCLEVPDTFQALGDLAHAWRKQFTIPIIAVTGSNGKTTTTQLIASILHDAYPNEQALGTQHNFNNAIGVPLTLLRLRQHHKIAVVEMGMNHPGEIAVLARMAMPTVALVNNALREHLEFMKSIEAVAEENGSVFSYLPGDGIAVFPIEDQFSARWSNMAKEHRLLRFSLYGQGAELTCTDFNDTNKGWEVRVATVNVNGIRTTFTYDLPLHGVHNIKNSLAAVACCLAVDVPVMNIVQGIKNFSSVKGRLNFHTVRYFDNDIVVIDDTYNANPDAVHAAIEVLAKQKEPKLLVLGSMSEVGPDGAQFHQQAGQQAQSAGIEYLFSFGELARYSSEAFIGGQHFHSIEDLNQAVQKIAPQVLTILVKGSRSMQMERVVASILGVSLNKIHTH